MSNLEFQPSMVVCGSVSHYDITSIIHTSEGVVSHIDITIHDTLKGQGVHHYKALTVGGACFEVHRWVLQDGIYKTVPVLLLHTVENLRTSMQLYVDHVQMHFQLQKLQA